MKKPTELKPKNGTKHRQTETTNQTENHFYIDPVTNKRYRPQNQIPVLVSSRPSVETGTSYAPAKNPEYPRYGNDSVHRSDPSTPNEVPVFECVSSKRTRRYYIGGIARTSNRDGFLRFLEQRGIHPTGLRMINTNRGSLAAKVTVNQSDGYTMENKTFWPGKFYCRRWYSNNAWNEKFVATNIDDGTNYNGYDQYLSTHVD